MKKWLSFGILIFGIPAVLVLGTLLFGAKQYAWLCLWIMVLTCGAFFLSFERKERAATKLVLIAVLSALSVAGRLLLAPLPGAKPVTAIVILSAMYLGSEAGFMVGAVTAILSNMYFGQGPWTPFQMFTWGLIGLLAGLLSQPLKKSKLTLCTYGAISGIVYSLLMDTWSCLWTNATLTHLTTLIASSIPYMAIYTLSNIVFLLLLEKPITQKLSRLTQKYGL